MRNKFTSLYALKQLFPGKTFSAQMWIYAGITCWYSQHRQLSELEFTDNIQGPIADDFYRGLKDPKLLGYVYEGHTNYWLPAKFNKPGTIAITGHEHYTVHESGMISLGFNVFDHHTHTAFADPILYHEINRSSVKDAEYDLIIPIGRAREHRLTFLETLKNTADNLSIVTDDRQTVFPTDLRFTNLGIEVYLNKFNINSSKDIFSNPAQSQQHQHSFYDEHQSRTVDHLPHKKMHSIARVNVILETTVYNVIQPYITEKTWKVLANHRPFVVLGDTNILKTLQAAGFKTFENFCDESYDTETDLNIKIVKVIEASKQLNEAAKNYPNEIDAICQHNQNWYFNPARLNADLAKFGKLCLDTIYKELTC
jgi:hypothetical protein